MALRRIVLKTPAQVLGRRLETERENLEKYKNKNRFGEKDEAKEVTRIMKILAQLMNEIR